MNKHAPDRTECSMTLCLERTTVFIIKGSGTSPLGNKIGQNVTIVVELQNVWQIKFGDLFTKFTKITKLTTRLFSCQTYALYGILYLPLKCCQDAFICGKVIGHSFGVALNSEQSISKSDTWLVPMGDHFCKQVDCMRIRNVYRTHQIFLFIKTFIITLHNWLSFVISHNTCTLNNKPKDGGENPGFPNLFMFTWYCANIYDLISDGELVSHGQTLFAQALINWR